MLYQVNSKKNKQGFSLVELIIAISIIAIFSTISFSAYNLIRTSNNLELVSLEIVESLRLSQRKAQSVKQDSLWGTKILNNEIIIFKGESYLNREIEFDQSFQLSSKITLTGLDEIIFQKVSGFTNNTGLISLNLRGKEKNIQINEKGIIFY